MPDYLNILLPILTLILGVVGAIYFLNTSTIGNLKESLKREQDLNSSLSIEIDETRAKLETQQRTLIQQETQLNHAKEQLVNQKKELADLEVKMTEKFELIANRIVHGNSKHIQEQHMEKLQSVLNPLKERIKLFEEKVDNSNKDNLKQNVQLKEQLDRLREMNLNLGKEAQNLTAALKGDKKLQGDWGEKQLEMILESAGLTKEIHYRKQSTYKNQEGDSLRPDVIINMPDGKNLIIDSKVSLVAYESYFNEEDNSKKKIRLAEHVNAIKTHVKQLSAKDYPALYGINPPDYVLMYVPLDASLYVAMSEDPGLFELASRSQIILVSNTTLLATLKTISYIWQQDLLNKNTQKIQEESAKLYDKFVSFVQSMAEMGNKLKSTQTVYDKALNQLAEGSGNLIKRTENLKKLGLASKKNLKQDIPQELIDKSGIDDIDLTQIES